MANVPDRSRGVKRFIIATAAIAAFIGCDSGKVSALLRMLEPYGIKEIAQSGLLAIGRGGKSITERVFKN